MGRLIVGPIISLLLTGLIYSGVFQLHPNLVLADLTRRSYLHFVCVGFIFHNFLNSGYYGFSSRIASESSGKTLSLIWLAPSHRVLSLLSLNALEYFRLLALIILTGIFGGLFTQSMDLVHQLWVITWFTALLFISLIFGFLRACVLILDRGYADLFDHAYLVFIFTACPYIPIGLLPRPISFLSQLNPLYYFLQIGRGAWETGSPNAVTLAWLFVFPSLVFLLALVLWRWLGSQVLDKSFS